MLWKVKSDQLAWLELGLITWGSYKAGWINVGGSTMALWLFKAQRFLSCFDTMKNIEWRWR